MRNLAHYMTAASMLKPGDNAMLTPGKDRRFWANGLAVAVVPIAISFYMNGPFEGSTTVIPGTTPEVVLPDSR